MTVKLSLGCFGLIKPEVDLIHTILRTSSRLDGRWEIVEQEECDAIILYTKSSDYFPLKLKQNTQLISIKKRGENYSGYIFYKPFRADELIDILIIIQSNIENSAAPTQQNSSPVQPKKTYKLKKWPTADILAIDKSYTLLSVYLSRSKKTLQDIAVLSGKTEEFCENFISLLESKELLNCETMAAPQVVHLNTNHREKSAKQTFFSQLRDRLGLSRS